MKVEDSEYIFNSLSGAVINNLSISEQNELLKINSILKTARRLEEYNPNLDKSISQIINFEEPDLLLISSNAIYAVEHFKIDASTFTKKGSTFKRKYNKKYSESINDKIKTKLEADGFAMISEEIETPLMYQNLYDNLVNIFNKHYLKITKYRENIESKLKIKDRAIKFVFFVQYDCIFPSFIFKDNSNKMRFIFPDNDLRFIEFCKSKKNLNGIFFDYNSNSYNFSNRKRFLLLDNDNLIYQQNNTDMTYDFTKVQVHDYSNPIATTVVASIKK
jgi:hypothetical protein